MTFVLNEDDAGNETNLGTKDQNINGNWVLVYSLRGVLAGSYS